MSQLNVDLLGTIFNREEYWGKPPLQIHANGSDGELSLHNPPGLNYEDASGTVFGDPVSDFESSGNWISFKRNNIWFTQLYSGAGVKTEEGWQLTGIFTHIPLLLAPVYPGPPPPQYYYWTTDPVASIEGPESIQSP